LLREAGLLPFPRRTKNGDATTEAESETELAQPIKNMTMEAKKIGKKGRNYE
jgi:hypothetical protein